MEAKNLAEYVKYSQLEIGIDRKELSELLECPYPLLTSIQEERVKLNDISTALYSKLICLPLDNRVPFAETYFWKSFNKSKDPYQQVYARLARKHGITKELAKLTIGELKQLCIKSGQDAEKIEEYFDRPILIRFFSLPAKRMARFVDLLLESRTQVQIEAETGIPRSTITSYIEKKVEPANIGFRKIMALCRLARITAEEFEAQIFESPKQASQVKTLAQVRVDALNLSTISLTELQKDIAIELRDRVVESRLRGLRSLIVDFQNEHDFREPRLARELGLTPAQLKGIKDLKRIPSPEQLIAIAQAGITDIQGVRYDFERLKSLIFDDVSRDRLV